MKNKHILILVTAIAIAGLFFVFGNVASAACSVSTTTCNNGPSNTNAHGCGTACVSLCNSSSFTGGSAGKEACRSKARNTSDWTKYRATRETCSYGCSEYYYGCDPRYEWSYTFVNIDSVCSTVDKCSASRCSSSENGPELRAGSCSCGSGGKYKICCKKSGSTYTPSKSVKYHSQDGQLPEEGHCGDGVKIFIKASDGSLSCPVPPTVSLYPNSNTAATSIVIKVGDPLTIRWTSGNATSCSSTGPATISGVNSRTSGSSSVNTNNLVERAEPYIYKITCSKTFPQAYDAGNVKMSTTKELLVYTRDPGAGTCPPASSFTVAEGATVTLAPSGASCTATCRRCSNDPSHIGEMATWTDDNFNQSGGGPICDDGWDDVAYAPSATCGPASCTANISASPTSISSGGSSTLTWSTSGATNCSIDSGIGSVGVSGSRSVSPASTTTYALNCSATSGTGGCGGNATVTVGGGDGGPEDCDVPGPTSVTADVSATRVCLPYHPNGNNPSPEERQTRITWSGSVQNKCSEIIGGGSPSNNNITCKNASGNWSLNQSGTSTISNPTGEGPYSPTSTQDYSISCTRAAYTCSSSRTFSGNGGSNDNDCEASCTSLKASYSAISSCSCSQGSCDVRWNASTNPSGSECNDWSSCPYTGHDEDCPSNGSHIDPDTGEIVLDYPASCTLYRDCAPCQGYNCRYYSYNQSVSSKDVCSSTGTDSQTVKFIQKPGLPTNSLRTDPLKPQILLNQFINLIWSVTKPDSGTPTTLKCTPSTASGDGTGWTGTLDSLASFGEKENLSPKVTTNYQLDCRNRDDSDSLRCYQDSDTARYEVKVFTVDLEEIPAFKGGFMNMVSKIGDSLRKAFN